MGDYRLTRDDVLAARRFADEIALCGAPIEDHGDGGGTTWEYVAEGGVYGIPYRHAPAGRASTACSWPAAASRRPTTPMPRRGRWPPAWRWARRPAPRRRLRWPAGPRRGRSRRPSSGRGWPPTARSWNRPTRREPRHERRRRAAVSPAGRASSPARPAWADRPRGPSRPRAARSSSSPARPGHAEALAGEIRAAGGTAAWHTADVSGRGGGRGGGRRLPGAHRAPRRRLQRGGHQRPPLRRRAAPRGDPRGLGDGHADERHEPVPGLSRGHPAHADPGTRRGRRPRRGPDDVEHARHAPRHRATSRPTPMPRARAPSRPSPVPRPPTTRPTASASTRSPRASSRRR